MKKKSVMEKHSPAAGAIVDDPENSVIVCFTDKDTRMVKAAAYVDVAYSRQKKITGLSKKASMHEAGGMFFPDTRSFWMPPSMKVDLDLVFLNKKGEVTEIIDMPRDNGKNTYMPKKAESCHALELNRGFCYNRGIRPGDYIQPLEMPSSQK